MGNSTLLWYKKPAENFNESLPLGNGRIGACIYGGIETENISLNEDTLWGGFPRESDKKCADLFEKIKKNVLDKKMVAAENLIESDFGDFLVQQYLPLGNIILDFENSGDITDYKRELDISEAISRVEYKSDNCLIKREYLVSKKQEVLAIKITSEKPNLTFRIGLKGKLKCDTSEDGDTLFIEGNCPIALAPPRDMYRTSECHLYSNNDSQKGVGYCAGVTATSPDGEISVENHQIHVKNAAEVYIYFAVRTSFNGPLSHPVIFGKEYRKHCIGDLQRAKALGYETVKASSVTEHQSLFNLTYLDLGDSENSALPTDERLVCHNKGEADNSLYTLLFNYGKYLTIAASRKWTRAMNLQGIWNEKLLAPWSSNYTLNINTEMNYWPTLQLGLFECYEPLIDFVRVLHINGKKTAENYYGLPGFVSHHASDVWGLTHPSTNLISDSVKWGFWNLSSGWLTKMLFDYYVYTNDKKYLQSVYNIIADCAVFYKSMLTFYEGRYILCPSTSPENVYLSDEHCAVAIDKTTAMTMQIVNDVFESMVSASEVLGKDADEYKILLSEIKTNFIDVDSSLNEWYESHTEIEPNHRHLSHLYGLFPSNQFNELERDAAKKVLHLRGDAGTGWSLAWKINLWARLGNGQKAKSLLDKQLHLVDSGIDTAVGTGGSYPNLFCAHPPFQIDGNFGATSGIIQMLLQADKDGEPVFLPAAPVEWENGEVKGFRLPNNKTVDFKWKKGKIIDKKVY